MNCVRASTVSPELNLSYCCIPNPQRSSKADYQLPPQCGVRTAAFRNCDLPSSRPIAWLILERDLLEMRFFTASPFACWTQGQPGLLREESQRAGCHARRLGSHARHGNHPAGFDCRVPLDKHQCQISNTARRTGTLRSGGTCAATSPFQEWCCPQLGVRVPRISPANPNSRSLQT